MSFRAFTREWLMLPTSFRKRVARLLITRAFSIRADHHARAKDPVPRRKDLLQPLEGLRKEYERHRFLRHQDARRVKTETIIETLAEHAGLVLKPTDANELERHLTVMRLIAEQRD